MNTLKMAMVAIGLLVASGPMSRAQDSNKYPLTLKFIQTTATTGTSTSTQTQTNCTPVPGTQQINCNSRQTAAGPHTSLTSTVEASDGNTYEVTCVLGAGARFLAGASNAGQAQSGLPTASGCQVQPGTYQARWDKGRFKVLMRNASGKKKELTFAILSSRHTEAQTVTTVNPARPAWGISPQQTPPVLPPERTAAQDDSANVLVDSRMGNGEAIVERCKTVESMNDAVQLGVCLGFIRGMADYESLRKSLDPTFMPLACFPQGVGDLQLAKIVVKYGNDHPQELHLPASLIVLNAMVGAFPCTK